MATQGSSSFVNCTACISTFVERQQEKFPLNTFFSLQTFRVYQSAVDFIGGAIEYPLSVLQV